MVVISGIGSFVSGRAGVKSSQLHVSKTNVSDMSDSVAINWSCFLVNDLARSPQPRSLAELYYRHSVSET